MFLSQEYSRTDPLPGFSSFFQENITKWRELNAAEDFVQAATALTHLTQTLPQLLHNVQPILDILLGRLHITAGECGVEDLACEIPPKVCFWGGIAVVRRPYGDLAVRCMV